MSNKDAVLADAISHYCALFDQISARYGADSERAKARMRWIIADAAALRQPTPEYGKVHTDGSRSGGQPPKPDDAMRVTDEMVERAAKAVLRRNWVSLTESDIDEMWIDHAGDARAALEAALK